MPALAKDKFIKRVQTPNRVHAKSLTNTDVKRLGPSRRISTKRTQCQAIQTETVLTSLLLNHSSRQIDEGTQTNDDMNDFSRFLQEGFGSRLIRFVGGTVVSLMKLFNHFS